MLQSLDELESGTALSSEVCVVGAGAAGQTVAKRLADLGHEVLLLESGGIDFDATVQQLNAADNIGLPYYDLLRARLRLHGHREEERPTRRLTEFVVHVPDPPPPGSDWQRLGSLVAGAQEPSDSRRKAAGDSATTLTVHRSPSHPPFGIRPPNAQMPR